MEQLRSELKGMPAEGVCPLASDGLDNLYVSTPEGYLWRSGLRTSLLASGQKETASNQKRADKANVVEIRPKPALDFPIRLLSISPNGSQAAVAGLKTDEDIVRLAIVDLTEAQHSNRHSKYMYCNSWMADEIFFALRPGLEILQVSWHPESLRHLLVLTSDNVLRLYCLDDLSTAEQSFSLQLTPERGLGLLDFDSESIVAFAFARGKGWEKYTIYLVSTAGNIFMLCPVAPFGSSYHPYTAEQMLDSVVDADDAESSISAAWLQQALPACIGDESYTPSAPSRHSAQQFQQVQPHALSEHTLSLQGPLQVSSPDSELPGALHLRQGNDTAACLSHTWYNEQCSVLTLASQGGIVAWHLIAHAPRPEWAERPPNCILSSDATIIAVKNQVSVSESWNGELLLLAAADVQLEASSESQELSEAAASPMLWPDPNAGDRWYLVHPRNVFALSAPWTLRLAHQLASGQEIDIQSDVGHTIVEELWAETVGLRQCVGACTVGSQLTTSSLLLLLSDGDLKSLQHTHLFLQDRERDEHGSDSNKERIDAQIKAIYNEVLCGPRRLELTLPADVGVQQPEGQRALGDCIKVLREKYVEFIHQAHNEVYTRFDVTEEGLKLQAERAKQIEQALAATQQKREVLLQRLKLCNDWNTNLMERMRLLTELHWSMPHPLSTAEAKFQDEELPELEKHIKQLLIKMKGLTKLSQKSKDTLPEQQSKSIPISQMRSMRAALLEQSEAITEAQNLLAAMQLECDSNSPDF